MAGKRSDALYCRDRCRVAASKARRGLNVPGVPVRSQAPSGLQVSHPKAVVAAAEGIRRAYELVGWICPERYDIAREVMAEVLSPAQRARLEARS